MSTEELARQAGIHITASDRVYGVALSGLMKDDLERFAALVREQALEDAASEIESYRGTIDSTGHILAQRVRALK